MQKSVSTCFLPGVACLFLGYVITGCEAVNSYHPNIVNGGRVNALGAHPKDDNTIMAAAETGGLFKTTDAGKTWTHLNGLKEFAMNDVKYAPGEPGIVLATTFVDTRTVNGGGIWRSTDGGSTWNMPPSSVLPLSARYPDRSSAFSIAFEPGSSTVIVGTDGGVAISNDLGATWRHVLPDPGHWVNADKTQDRIYSVLCRGGGLMNIAGTNGVYYSTNGGTTWTLCTTGPSAVGWGFHRFAVSPFNNKHIFLTSDRGAYRDNPADPKNPFTSYETYLSADGGVSWTSINVPEDGFNRPSFIKTSLSLNNVANQFELWYGSGYDVYRKTCTNTASGPNLSGKWNVLAVNHKDPADLVFATDNRTPCILASDAGILKTDDRGINWYMAGGGNSGLNALQITEVNGHQVAFRSYKDKEPDFHTDMYFGTQDNYLWASPDGGRTWPYASGGEGFYVQPEGRKILSSEEARVVFVSCGACDNRYSGAYFDHEVSWSNPNNKLEGNPFYLFTPGHYVENSLKAISATENVNNFQFTYSYGAAWTPKADVAYGLYGYPHIAPSTAGPVIYQAVARPGFTPSGNTNIGLIKIKGIESSSPAIYNADGNGFGSLGIFATMFAWYVVYGVDPGNPNHLIIADVGNKKMKYSFNGGRCWYTDEPLTQLVTDKGNLRFEDGPFLMQVHAIAFDPDDPRRIAIGTQQAGVICSLNGGVTWEKIEKTEQITNVSSFFFGLDNTLYVSSYGRGLWKINLEKANSNRKREPDPVCVNISFRDRLLKDEIMFEDLSDIRGCRDCKLFTVRDGAVTDVLLDETGKLKSVAVSGGRLTGYDSLLHEAPAANIPYQVNPQRGRFNNDSVARQILRNKEIIRGFVMQKDRLRGYIVSNAPFPLYEQVLMRAPGNEPRLFLRSEQMFAGLPGVSTGDTLFISGQHFTTDKYPLVLMTGSDSLATVRATDATGGFAIGIVIRGLKPGLYNLRVIQQGPNGPVQIATAWFRVLLSDMDEKKERD